MADKGNCPYCACPLKRQMKPYLLHGVYLGRFSFLVCSVCRRTYHPPKTSSEIEEAAKEKGLWGLEGRSDSSSIVVVTRDTSTEKLDRSMPVMVSGESVYAGAEINDPRQPKLERPARIYPPRVYGIDISAPTSNAEADR